MVPGLSGLAGRRHPQDQLLEQQKFDLLGGLGRFKEVVREIDHDGVAGDGLRMHPGLIGRGVVTEVGVDAGALRQIG